MDTTHFVLMVAVFVVVATAMFSISQYRAAPPLPDAAFYTCRFETLCRGEDCALAPPGDIAIVLQPETGQPYLSHAETRDIRETLVADGPQAWVGRRGAAGSFRVSVDEVGGFTYVERAGMAGDSDILVRGTGRCQDRAMTSQGQN